MTIRDLIPSAAGKQSCEQCKTTFPVSDIKLIEVTWSGFMQITQVLTFMYLSKDAKGVWRFCGGAEPPREGDMVGACPNCDHVHHFGFDPPNKE